MAHVGSTSIFINTNMIPLTIITSNGLGGDIIKLVFKKYMIDFDKINILSNHIIWDENGKFLDIQKPIIHVLNKDEVIIKDEKIKKQIEGSSFWWSFYIYRGINKD